MLYFSLVAVMKRKIEGLKVRTKTKTIVAVSVILGVVLIVITSGFSFFSFFLEDHFDTENGMIDYDGTWFSGYISKHYNDHMEIDWLIGGYDGQYVACNWRFELTIRSPSGQSYSTTYQCQVPDEYYLGDDDYAITTDFGYNKKFNEIGEWDITQGELIAKVENDWVELDIITDSDDVIAVDYSTEWQVSTFSATPSSINSGENVTVSYLMTNIGDIPSTNCYRIFCDLNGNQHYDSGEKVFISYCETDSVGGTIDDEVSKVLTSDDAVDGIAYITLEFDTHSDEYHTFCGSYNGLSMVTVAVLPISLPPSIDISATSTVVVVSTGFIAFLSAGLYLFRKIIFGV